MQLGTGMERGRTSATMGKPGPSRTAYRRARKSSGEVEPMPGKVCGLLRSCGRAGGRQARLGPQAGGAQQREGLYPKHGYKFQLGRLAAQPVKSILGGGGWGEGQGYLPRCLLVLVLSWVGPQQGGQGAIPRRVVACRTHRWWGRWG